MKLSHVVVYFLALPNILALWHILLYLTFQEKNLLSRMVYVAGNVRQTCCCTFAPSKITYNNDLLLIFEFMLLHQHILVVDLVMLVG
jgi:hypothetical protein